MVETCTDSHVEGDVIREPGVVRHDNGVRVPSPIREKRLAVVRGDFRRAKNLRAESSRTKNDPRGGNFGLDPLLLG